MASDSTNSHPATFELGGLAIGGTMFAVVFAVRLSMPDPVLPAGVTESRGRMVIALAIFMVQIGLAVVGRLLVQQTIAAGGRVTARIQAEAFQVACLAALGIGLIVAPNRTGAQAGLVMDAAGITLVLLGAFLARSLAPSAVRQRLERPADERVHGYLLGEGKTL